MRKFYTGNVTPEANTIFVFGSNPEGRHGAGAAKVARNQFDKEESENFVLKWYLKNGYKPFSKRSKLLIKELKD